MITFNALISACANDDNTVKALLLLAEMQRKGLEPDVITYIAPINACAKGDYAEKTLRLLDEMQRKGLEPNVKHSTLS